MRIGVSLPVRDLAGDMATIRRYSRRADELGFDFLLVPDRVIRADPGHRHEPLMLLAFVAALTERIELLPSVIITPSRQTALLAKQAAELDELSGGRFRLGVGVGASPEEYRALGQEYGTRGARLEEQIPLLRRLWSEPTVDFQGRFDVVEGAGLDPRPPRPIPIWIGAGRVPGARILDRMGRLADGWFALCGPDEYPALAQGVAAAARAADRDPSEVGAQATVVAVGPRGDDWPRQLERWHGLGVTDVNVRTVGADLDGAAHLARLEEIGAELDSVRRSVS